MPKASAKVAKTRWAGIYFTRVLYILKLSKGRLFVHEVKSVGNSWMLIEVHTLPDSPGASLDLGGGGGRGYDWNSTYDRFKKYITSRKEKAPVDFEWARKDRIWICDTNRKNFCTFVLKSWILSLGFEVPFAVFLKKRHFFYSSYDCDCSSFFPNSATM